VEPLVQGLSPKEASAKVKAGAGLIDVRLESEYAHGSLKHAVNIPLYLLRLKAEALDPGRPYVVFCDTGVRSATAAFILNEKGFDVWVLEGGLGKYREVPGS
jgi:rhodanese-related sulfurtransferase